MLCASTRSSSRLAAIVLSLPFFASASALHAHRHEDHAHNTARSLPGTWFQRDDHPVHALFKRGGATDGVSYAAIGSDAWTNAYPPWSANGPDAKPEWITALNDAVSRKAIPSLSPSVNPGNGEPTYGNLDPNGAEVCSATYGCRIKGDVWDAPDGHIGISFDDGPLPPTDGLLDFLDAQKNKQPVTHFMIGSNILYQPSQFTRAFQRGDDIAVHTWTHPMMTTLSNEKVVAELGWTMEIIHNSTGGRVPRFWRPPYGDTDNRVSAIAKEVFGLTTIIWNQDTADWSLDATPPGTTPSAINASMTQWLKGSKSPGLIILEHELSDMSVGAFKAAYPVMLAQGWTLDSLATLIGNGTVYQNAQTDTSAVEKVGDVVDAKSAGVPVAASSGTSTSASKTGTGTTTTAKTSGVNL
ncbi:carbohydrate esterase family 4 protein [Mycena amicta]|nr:carbohydrate esterase family 4 protein [Mycena amicta]